MEIVGDYPYGSIIVTDQLLAVDNVFLSGLRIRLLKNALLVNAMFLKIISHALGFGERLVRSFSAGNDADGIRILIQILNSLVETVTKHKAWPGLAHLSSKHHHIIEIWFTLRMHFADNATFHRAECDQTDACDCDCHTSDQSWQHRPPLEEHSESKHGEQRREC